MALLAVSEETARAALRARAELAWWQGPSAGTDPTLDGASRLLGLLAGREAHQAMLDRSRSKLAVTVAQGLEARAGAEGDPQVAGELRAAVVLVQKLILPGAGSGEDDDGDDEAR